MIKPSFLQRGNLIGIAAPGRKVSRDVIQSSMSIFESWGLRVMLASNLFSEQHSYLAGTDEQRLSDFNELIRNPEVKTIICARGGYGSSRFIDQVDFSSMRKNPKWIVGFSDVTAFHLKLLSLDIQSIHGTMPILFAKPESVESVESLRKTLFGEPQIIPANGSFLNKPGTAKGILIGGNLSLLVDSLGTSSEADTAGKILVIEEIEEYRYKIDRMMNHLNRAGKLESLSGLIVGHLTDVLDTELSFGETPQEIILNHVKEYSFPVAFNFPMGHENPNLAWVQGHPAALVVEKEKSILTFV